MNPPASRPKYSSQDRLLSLYGSAPDDVGEDCAMLQVRLALTLGLVPARAFGRRLGNRTTSFHAFICTGKVTLQTLPLCFQRRQTVEEAVELASSLATRLERGLTKFAGHSEVDLPNLPLTCTKGNFPRTRQQLLRGRQRLDRLVDLSPQYP